jgi:hypothetical protein
VILLGLAAWWSNNFGGAESRYKNTILKIAKLQMNVGFAIVQKIEIVLIISTNLNVGVSFVLTPDRKPKSLLEL